MPVLPATSIGKSPKTSNEVPAPLWAASWRPSRISARWVGSMWTWRCGAGVEFLQHAAGGVVDLHADVRGDDGAAVAERRVGERQLQRVRLQVPLAGGELDVVARRPAAFQFPFRGELVAPVLGRQQPLAAPGRSMSVAADPELVRPLLQEALVPHAKAERVEVDVGGDFQRPDEADRSVGRFPRVREGLPADDELAGVVDHFVRRDFAVFERRQSGDDLEGRAARIEAGDRAVRERGVDASRYRAFTWLCDIGLVKTVGS